VLGTGKYRALDLQRPAPLSAATALRNSLIPYTALALVQEVKGWGAET
jgi:hypothetical protein